MNVADALSGRAGIAGVQWLLLDSEPHEALRRQLAALLPSAELLGPCRLHRAKYKPGRHLTAYYAVSLVDPEGGAERSRQVEVSWMPPGADDPRGAPEALAAMQDEAARRGVATPFRALMAEDPAWGMRVQVAPLDVSFPQLARVCDPAHVRRMLRGLTGSGADEAPPPVRVSAVRYRPGQRHVLRYDSDGPAAVGAPSRTLFAKIYNSDKGARTFEVVSRAAAWLEANGDGLVTVRPEAYLSQEQTVLYPQVFGTPLSELLREPGDESARRVRQAGAALRALHRAPTSLLELRPHSFEKELKSIVSASEHVRPLLPETGARIAALLERARKAHERLPQEEPSFAYGDFKSDHLWATPEGLTLIDFDTCYLFDPAIDVGKYLADLRWWYDSYRLDGVQAAQEQFLAGYGSALSDERLARARLYEALILVKTTVRRVRVFDSDWAPRTERLIREAESVLA